MNKTVMENLNEQIDDLIDELMDTETGLKSMKKKYKKPGLEKGFVFLTPKELLVIDDNLVTGSSWDRGDRDDRAIDGFLMDLFDGRRSFSKMNTESSFYQIWNKRIGTNGKPFGEFKNYMNWRREDIYAKFIEIFTTTPAGKEFSPLDIFIELAPKIIFDAAAIQLDKKTLERAVSYRLWYSTKGICGEAYVHKAMKLKAKARGVVYEEAKNADELSDVDSFLKIVRLDGTVKIRPISVKVGGALNISFLWHEYRKKGKTRPEFYVGFSDDINKELKWISAKTVDAWGAENG